MRERERERERERDREREREGDRERVCMIRLSMSSNQCEKARPVVVLIASLHQDLDSRQTLLALYACSEALV